MNRLYLCAVVVRERDGVDMGGSAKLIFAGSQAEALHHAEQAASAELPRGARPVVLTQQITEVQRELLERAAVEILGWKRPD